MLKSKVIQTIVEACRQSEPRARNGAAGTRSPAAGGGVAGPAPPPRRGRQAKSARDPRLGQIAPARKPASGRRRA